jgi:hypothetical protein
MDPERDPVSHRDQSSLVLGSRSQTFVQPLRRRISQGGRAGPVVFGVLIYLPEIVELPARRDVARRSRLPRTARLRLLSRLWRDPPLAALGEL